VVSVKKYVFQKVFPNPATFQRLAAMATRIHSAGLQGDTLVIRFYPDEEPTPAEMIRLRAVVGKVIGEFDLSVLVEEIADQKKRE